MNARPRPVSGRSHARKFKTAVAVMLVVLAAVAPIPAGSNRPLFWAIAGITVGIVGVLYFAGILWTGAATRLRFAQAGLPLVLTLILLTWLIVQTVPLAALNLPAEAQSLFGPIVAPTISLAPGATWLMVLQFATYGVLGLLFVQVTLDRSRAIWVMHGLFYVITAHAAYALLVLTQFGDTLLILEKWAYEGSATGTFVNRNSFATFLAFGLVVGLSLILRNLERLRMQNGKIGYMRGLADWPSLAIVVACMLVQAAALVATESRLGVASAVLGGTAGLSVYLSRQRGTGRAGLPFILFAAVLAIGAAFWLYGGGLIERLGSLQQSADVRGALYAQVIDMIRQRPWTGYGGGSFEVVYPYFHRLPVSPDLIWDKAHSTYLGLWSDLGLVFGTVPMLVVLFSAIRLWLVARWRPRDWAMPLAGLSVIVVAAVHSVADFSLEIEANAIMFIAIVAVAMATPTEEQLIRRDA